MENPFSKSGLLKSVNVLDFNQIPNKFLNGSRRVNNPNDRATTHGITLNEPEIKVPRFPIEVFPMSIQEIIRATNEGLNFPIDFFAASILFTVSVAVGNTYRLKVKNDWEESAALFLVNVGRPNTNKSHPLSFALRPLFEMDKKSLLDYQQKKCEYDRAVKMSKGSKNRQLPEPIIPVLKKSILTDFTLEAMIQVLKNNIRGVGVYADELASWFKNFNRYHKGADQEFWLSAWSGKPYYNDRVSTEPIFLLRPFASVIGNIPTYILNELAKENRSKNGFIDRILFAFPDGLKKAYLSESEIENSVKDDWYRIVTKLRSLQPEFEDDLTLIPTVLPFTTKAYKEFLEWEKALTDLSNGIEDELLAGIYGKFDIHVPRFALSLELLRYACNEGNLQEVGIESLNGALQLAEYFQATAVKVHSIISNENPLARLTATERELYLALPDYFKTNQGYEVAIKYKMTITTFNRFLRRQKDKLFLRIRQGEYGKLI